MTKCDTSVTDKIRHLSHPEDIGTVRKEKKCDRCDRYFELLIYIID